jgi:hypothetical protein
VAKQSLTGPGQLESFTCEDNGCSKAGGVCQISNPAMIQSRSRETNFERSCACTLPDRGLCAMGTNSDGMVACKDSGCSKKDGVCKLFYSRIEQSNKNLSSKRLEATPSTGFSASCGCDVSPILDENDSKLNKEY